MDEDSSSLNLGEDFENAEALTISEVYLMLKEKKTAEETDGVSVPTAGNEIKEQFFKYCEQFAKLSNKEQIKQLKMKMARRNLKPFESAQLINLQPADGEEARVLLPSLANHDEDSLTELLVELDNAAGTL